MLNHEFLLIFILAHLTGDYALQTDNIAKQKSESIKGIAIHVSLVCLSQMLFLSLFGIRGIAAALTGAGIHFFIDLMKLRLGERLKRIELLYYFLDQALHLLVIVVLTLVFAPAEGSMGSYILYVKLLIGLVLLVYTATVTAKNVARHFFRELKARRFFEKNERWIDAVTGGLLFASGIARPLISSLLLLAGIYFYNRLQAAAFGYGWKISLVKYITLMVFALLVLILLDRLFYQPFL